MKTPIKYLCLPAFLFSAPILEASLYEGSWKNTTFNSTGALKIDLTIEDSRAKGSFDLDGPVFGGMNPPAIPFNFPIKSDGTGKFKVTGTLIGDLNGTVDADGNLSVKITNIPGGFLTEARFDCSFDLILETFSVEYEVDNSGGLYAQGAADAHVHKAAVVKVKKTTRFTGATAEVKATVLANSDLTSVKARIIDGAGKVSVTGKGPYNIVGENLKAGTTTVKFTVRNADGFTTNKIVKFVR